jgi:hypothetical protein
VPLRSTGSGRGGGALLWATRRPRHAGSARTYGPALHQPAAGETGSGKTTLGWLFPPKALAATVSSLKNDLVDYEIFARQAGDHASLAASQGRDAALAA